MYMYEVIEWYNANFYKDRTIKFRLKDIFSDHWNNFIKDNPDLNIRPVVFKEVDKMISCRTSVLGYSVYECPDCGEIKFSYHTCKSRFCPSCGNKYVRKRTETILSWFKEQSKSEEYIPGIIAVLHTYGRDMKWNTHIHSIVTEGAMGKSNVFKKFEFIPYSVLRKRFQTILLNSLEKELGKDKFKDIKNFIYKKSNNGFYVYAEKKCNSSTKSMIEYAVRYTGKPAMAESRILDYDGEYITFWYQRHEDNKIVKEKIHVYEFFKRLIIHIPDHNFKTVRYYGIYSKKHKFHDKMVMLIKSHTYKLRDSLNSWRMMILKDFDTDPLTCPKCGNLMLWQYRVC